MLCQSLYEQIVELTSDAILLIDEGGMVSYANDAAGRLFGTPRAGLVGHPLSNLLTRPDGSTGSQLVESTGMKRDGTTFPAEVSWSASTGQSGTVAIIRDITTRASKQPTRGYEDHLLKSIDTIPALTWSTLQDGSVDFVNERWRDYTGLSTEEALGWGWKSALHPDDFAALLDVWSVALQTGAATECEARLRRFDGEFRWFLFRTVPLHNDSGKIVKWFGCNVDIEDRKHAEEAIRNSEAELRVILDAIPALVVCLAPNGRYLSVNQKFADTVGTTISDLLDRGLAPFLHPDDSERTLRAWGQALESGSRFQIESRMMCADGSYRWFYETAHPLHDKEGNLIRWYGLLLDVDEWKNTETALQESEKNFLLLIETIPAIWVWSITANGQISRVNQRVLDYTGKVFDHFAHLSFGKIIHPDDVDEAVSKWLDCLARGVPYEIRNRLRKFDGTYRWFHLFILPLHNQEGQVYRWYGFAFDIDDNKRIEEDLRNTQERLSLATQAATIGEFAASIAHEVNQPLAAIVANGHASLRWLLALPPNFDEANQAVRRIIRDGKEAAEIVLRTKALFRRSIPNKTALNLNDIAREVTRLLRDEAVKHRAIVETDLAPFLPPVSADRLQIGQVLFNLVKNGIEAVSEVKDRPRKVVVRSMLQAEGSVLVEVKDCGVGLKDVTQIFEAFVTTKENGMGMGLVISRSIVESHDGLLWAVKNEDAGATFCFTLPALHTN